MAHSVQHTMKGKGPSSIKFTSRYKQRKLHNLQKKDRFDEGYDNDGQLGPFCNMEYIEYT